MDSVYGGCGTDTARDGGPSIYKIPCSSDYHATIDFEDFVANDPGSEDFEK